MPERRPRDVTPVRIALVVPSLARGGGVPSVARFLRRVLDASDRYAPFLVSLAMSSRDEASVRLLDPRSWRGGPEIREGSWEGRSFVHVGAWMAELEFMRYAPRRVLTERLAEADLVQVVAGSPCWVLPALPADVPVCLQVATLARWERARRHRVERGAVALWRRAMTAVTEQLDRRGLRRADRIFVENRRMEREASAVAGSDRVVYAPPGVDVKHFRPPDDRDDRAENEYILSVARFDDPRKNPELLFRAYARLRKDEPSVPELWLAGSSGPPEAAWGIAQDHGVAQHVRYLGEVSDQELAQLYRKALVFVLASDEEGFGLVLAEAMASGTPVVSTACGGPEDVVTHGDDGLLVPVGDDELLAKAMQRLLDRPGQRQAMGERARHTAVKRFSLQAAGARFLKEYDAVLSKTGDRKKTTVPNQCR